MPPAWVFPGDSLFPLVHWWCHSYVIPLPAKAPPLPDESSNQELSRLDTSSHMRYNHLERVFPTSFFIQLLEETHLMLTAHQHTWHIAYLDSHIQGKCVFLAPHVNFIHIPTYHASLVHMTNLIFFPFKDGRLDIWRCTHSHTKPTFYTSISLAKRGWPSLGGYTLCKNPHYPMDVHHAAHHSRKMGREWELQPRAYGMEGDYSHSTAILIALNPDMLGAKT